MNGIINVLKPTGMTSHDVVNIVRKKINVKKVGHTGTLDPNASGVLPILIGKATKLSDFYMKKDKEYRCQMRFGISTDTKDSSGKITEVDENLKFLNVSEIKATLNKFKGKINQIPPIYSAIKINGKKLYSLARKGVELQEIPKREVTIYDIEFIKYNFPYFTFDCRCSSGTYIRTLIEDIATSLNTKAYMSILIRTISGEFKIENSTDINKITKDNLINVDDLNLGFSEIVLSNDEINDFIQGKKIYPVQKSELRLNDEGIEYFKVYDMNKNLISIAYIDGNIGILKNKILL